jgi:phosphotransferase system HPr-like phosphotransfer protein
MNILLLAAGPGTKILVEANGSDEKDALDSMAALFLRKFKMGG